MFEQQFFIDKLCIGDFVPLYETQQTFHLYVGYDKKNNIDRYYISKNDSGKNIWKRIGNIAHEETLSKKFIITKKIYKKNIKN